jgi:acetylornithine deacetylase
MSTARDILVREAVGLLEQLIRTPSLSRQENLTADILQEHLTARGLEVCRSGNNVWVRHDVHPDAPCILLNSHHDTVRPSSSWTRDPFSPTYQGDVLYGLGSNDAGASVVSLMAAFLLLREIPDRTYNLIYAATAEEEVTGLEGIYAILPCLGRIDLAIVGEPTGMQMAIAEKGLMVLDATTRGKTGHAARNEGINALYLALDDIAWFRSFRFSRNSELLGEVKMTVSMIQAGQQHNIIPDVCTYVVDIRTNEHYTNEQVLEEIRQHLQHSEVVPRSTNLNSSGIDIQHPFVQRGLSMGIPCYGSPTTSDQVRMGAFPSLKMGPGRSERSHSADEYILISEISEGINQYVRMLSDFKFNS